jgi:hypothetical protein
MEYSGSVHPHPQFELRLDAQGNIMISNADLAVVRLDTPVQSNIPPIRLAEKPAQAGETMTVVGYGYIEPLGGMDGKRRFNREKVLRPLDPDGKRAVFGQPDLHAYKGDTGGPCLRETGHGPELLGISSRGLGREPTFTSTAPYWVWLSEQIRLAERERSTELPLPEFPQGATP